MAIKLFCKSCGKPVLPARKSRSVDESQSGPALRLTCPSCQAAHAYTLQDLLEATNTTVDPEQPPKSA